MCVFDEGLFFISGCLNFVLLLVVKVFGIWLYMLVLLLFGLVRMVNIIGSDEVVVGVLFRFVVSWFFNFMLLGLVSVRVSVLFVLVVLVRIDVV